MIDAVGQGNGASAILERVGEIEMELEEVSKRGEQLRNELAVIETQVIDEDELRDVLAAFDPIWDELFPAEKARILNLLIDSVTYDG